MFEQILKELKTKYHNLGLSEEYLKVIANRIAKTVKEEAEISNAVSEVEDEMKFQQKQADIIRTIQAELKKALSKEDKGKKEDKKEEPAKKEEENNEMPAWAKALLENNEALLKKIQGIENEKIQQSNEQKLISKFKELEVNENFYKLQMQGKTFENDEEIEAFANLVKQAETSYLQVLNDNKLGGGTPPKKGDGEESNEVSGDVQAFIKSKFKQNEGN